MTIEELREKIESYPEETMPFCIDDVFSWRGVYAEPACSLSTDTTTKEHNYQMLDRLENETFEGWKGGEYTYHPYDDLHFEDEPGNWSDGQYLIDFLLNNSKNKAVKHIFHS